MSPSPLTRILVEPGPAGVATLTTALSAVLKDESGPIALVPTESTGIPPQHAAALSSAVGGEAPITRPGAAVVLATSGTTGEPIGVVLSKDGLQSAARLSTTALGPPGLWLTAIPVTGIGGLMTVARALISGGLPIAWPGVSGAAPFTAESFDDAARETLRRANSDGVPAYVSLVPTQLTRLLGNPGALETLAGFGRVIVGGSPLSRRIQSLAESAGISIVATYGSTETCGGVVYNGVPLPGVDVQVSDAGVISVAGPTLALGYRLRPDLDKRRFRDGRFITSDLGRWSDGKLLLLGRSDKTIKVGGVKVSLPGITQALLSHPRVIDAVTVAEPDTEWGVVPHAFVIPDEHLRPNTPEYEALIAELTEQVRSRHGRAAAPRRMTLTDRLPVLHSGKTAAPGQGGSQ